MRSSVPLVLLAWSVSAIADSTSAKATDSTASSCAAQAVLDDCLGMLQPRLAACPANDWNCMCTESINVLTCYNNCPNDSGAFGAQQTKISYCNAANAYPSSTTVVAASTQGANQPSSTSEGTPEGSPGGSPGGSSEGSSEGSSDGSSSSSRSSPTGSSSSSAATPSTSSVKVSTGAAAELGVEVGSLLAAIVLGVGAAL